MTYNVFGWTLNLAQSNACRDPAIENTCTIFRVDISSHFSLEHRITDATDHPTHASATADMGNEIVTIPTRLNKDFIKVSHLASYIVVRERLLKH